MPENQTNQEIKSHKETKQIIQKTVRKFEIKFVKTIFSIVFATLAALAWETAISEILREYLPQDPSPWYWIGYAVVITLIVVIANILMGGFMANLGKGNKDE